MQTNSRIARSPLLTAALLMSLFLIATSQAQTDLPIFTGKFTLTTQVQWGNSVLQPGDYTVSLGPSNGTTSALVRDSKGRGVGRFKSWFDEGRMTGAGNLLLMSEKDGQLHVYSLDLGSLRRVLVYDPGLARQAVLEARAPQTVPLMLTKR